MYVVNTDVQKGAQYATYVYICSHMYMYYTLACRALAALTPHMNDEMATQPPLQPPRVLFCTRPLAHLAVTVHVAASCRMRPLQTPVRKAVHTHI